MNLDKCRALVCAIDSKSITAAAAKMSFTPSAISRMIASLEEELGFPLLVRKHVGVTPTQECARLLPEIREMLFHEDTCLQTAACIRGVEAGSVTVGIANATFYSPIASLVGEFTRNHPNIAVDIRSGRSSKLFDDLANRTVDICLVTKREGSYVWQQIGRDELVAWVPASHRLASCDAIPIGAFAQEAYIDIFPGLDVDNARAFAAIRVIPNTRYSTVDSLAAWEMVRSGLGIAMNNRANTVLRDPGVKVLPLDPPQPLSCGFARREDASPAALVLWEALVSAPRSTWPVS
ncbi:MAG: LysR family transcriptional regulator [Parafannyhessea umbonata]|jgi:DNA-binding transcriptional LysR family regulator|nr:LysR family transcriptional regulator [Parafannyhessea umbonata]